MGIYIFDLLHQCYQYKIFSFVFALMILMFYFQGTRENRADTTCNRARKESTTAENTTTASGSIPQTSLCMDVSSCSCSRTVVVNYVLAADCAMVVRGYVVMLTELGFFDVVIGFKSWLYNVVM